MATNEYRTHPVGVFTNCILSVYHLQYQNFLSNCLRIFQKVNLRQYIAPSADVTIFGNSGTGALDSQVIAYQIDSGGTADIHFVYDSGDNYRASLPISLALLK